MRLISAAAEASLIKKIRKAHIAMVNAILRTDLVELAFAFGHLAEKKGIVPSEASARQLMRAGSIRLDDEAVEQTKERLGDTAETLCARVVGVLKAALADGAAVLRRQKLSRRGDAGKARRKAVARVLGLVEKAMLDAGHNWGLAVDAVIHEATDEGRAHAIVKARGRDPLVWKKVLPDCCPYCRLLYTIDGVKPRLFRLSELVDNGSNIGRRANRPVMDGENATEYLPVLGPVHPGCRCSLQSLPPGMSKADPVEEQRLGLQYIVERHGSRAS